ncbi:MAG: CCA tRNA nucleotidyltransferase, partial [Candidatus Caldarchaeum sp.]
YNGAKALTYVEELLESVAQRLRPSPETLEKAKLYAEKLVKSVEELFGPGTASVEGSFARGTMVRSREEVDIFIHFKPETPVERAAEDVLKRGTELVKNLGGTVRLRYASHPYVEGFLEGLRVNLVPCYDTEYGKWITPVDRTPYHTRYVKSVLDERMADEVRLLKAFLMNDGLYGAEIRNKGFSGYVCELLIIRFGSFLQLVRQASGWKPPVVLDGEKPMSPASAITLLDPVDKTRNAAAAVSLTTLSKLIMKSKLFLKEPSDSYFLSRTSFKPSVEGRCFLAVVLDVPERPPDVLWGELTKTLEGLAKALSGYGFKPLRTDRWFEDGKGLLIFELESLSLPQVYLHTGPPVWSMNAVEFIDEQARKQDLAAYPWVEGERLCSLRRRRFTNAADFVKHLIDGDLASFSKNLRPFLKKSKIYTNLDEVYSAMSEEGRIFLDDFVRTCPNFIAQYHSLG